MKYLKCIQLNSLDLAQFQRVKLNETIKNKFENSKDPIQYNTTERNCQPKKKIITLEQILIKVILTCNSLLITR